ncbi:MAG: Mrp/NBP35 family ATP-binding protein [Sedimentisphaerales bacterium]|nr:Mrp/NBP35 family ATP-binding protein [Sedimentisphaerales bacterium]
MPEKTTASKIEDKRKQQNQADEEQIRHRLARIKHQILVLSGKGGVGKSTVAANLAVSLVLAQKHVGLLDIDIHGPSIPKILNLEGRRVESMGHQIMPIEVMPNFKVMSIGFLLPARDDAVIWRGPMKYQMIKQFIKDVEWGNLDFLIVDSPPGTGDEPLSVIQLLGKADGAIVVTTPQELALADVRKGINFCKSLGLPVLGVLENMSGFVCPKCGQRTDIFKSGGGEKMSMQMEVPFLGTIPIDPAVVQACDLGMPFVRSGDNQSETARAFAPAVQTLLDLDEDR